MLIYNTRLVVQKSLREGDPPIAQPPFRSVTPFMLICLLLLIFISTNINIYYFNQWHSQNFLKSVKGEKLFAANKNF